MDEHTVKDIDDELLHDICQVFRGWGTVPETGAKPGPATVDFGRHPRVASTRT
jgi:hypothetical protein